MNWMTNVFGCRRRLKIRPPGRSKSRPVRRARLGACSLQIASTVQGALAGRPITGQAVVRAVRSNFAVAERELLNDMINEVDRVWLRVLVVDFKRPDTCRIVDCRVLEPAHLLAAFPP